METYGSVLLVTAIGVFLYAEMLLASSEMYLVESSRSLATLVANFPVSFWTFCKSIQYGKSSFKQQRLNLDMSLDFRSDFLQMLDDGTFDCTTEISMLIGDDACFISNAIVHVLSQIISMERIPLKRDRTLLVILLPQGIDSQI